MKNKKSSLVQCSLLGVACNIDGEKHWQDFLAQSSEGRLSQCCSPIHFMIQLHFIDISQSIKDRFFGYFSSASAIDSRKCAIDGLVQKNYEQADFLLDTTQSFIRDRATGQYADDKDHGFAMMAAIAASFADIIEKRDTATLRRVINVIENRGVPDGSRGGIGSEDRYMLEKFAELHAANRSLPTKKALRDACGLKAREDEKLAAKRMKKLGLWGLPTEPEI